MRTEAQLQAARANARRPYDHIELPLNTADGLNKPDLVAPGRSVVSLRAPGSTIDSQFPGGRVGDAYFKGSGTSFATAITSGAAADMLEADPRLSPDRIKSRLLARAAPAPSPDRNVAGRGSLDLAAASRTLAAADQYQTGVERSHGGGPAAELDPYRPFTGHPAEGVRAPPQGDTAVALVGERLRCRRLAGRAAQRAGHLVGRHDRARIGYGRCCIGPAARVQAPRRSANEVESAVSTHE